MWWTEYWHMPWMLFGPMMMIIFMVICLAIMFSMMRGGTRHRDHGERALNILKERYAARRDRQGRIRNPICCH
jgi:uncharacterized membrane protein